MVGLNTRFVGTGILGVSDVGDGVALVACECLSILVALSTNKDSDASVSLNLRFLRDDGGGVFSLGMARAREDFDINGFGMETAGGVDAFIDCDEEDRGDVRIGGGGGGSLACAVGSSGISVAMGVGTNLMLTN